jgi:hypothetical protein
MSVLDSLFNDYEIISEHIDRSSPSAVVRGRVDWSDRLSIANQLVGGLAYNGGSWAYNQPTQYPFLGTGICCNSVDIVSLGDFNVSNGQYQTAELTCTFGVYPFLPYSSTTPLTICQVTANCSAEQIPMPDGSFQWPDGSTLSDDDFKPSMVFPYVELKVKVCFTSTPQILACSSLLGQVNTATLYLPNPVSSSQDAFGPNTVLFMAVSPEMVCNSEGYLCYTRELTLGIRDNDGLGWNGIWRPATNEFETPVSVVDEYGNGGGYNLYDQGDFSTLFGI